MRSAPWWPLLYCIFNRLTLGLYYRKLNFKIPNGLEVKLEYPQKYPSRGNFCIAFIISWPKVSNTENRIPKFLTIWKVLLFIDITKRRCWVLRNSGRDWQRERIVWDLLCYQPNIGKKGHPSWIWLNLSHRSSYSKNPFYYYDCK